MELHGDVKRMIRDFDDFGQGVVRRGAGYDQAVFLELLAVVLIEFEAVTVAFRDGGFAIKLMGFGVFFQVGYPGA